jgi:hypothetical protein
MCVIVVSEFIREAKRADQRCSYANDSVQIITSKNEIFCSGFFLY